MREGTRTALLVEGHLDEGIVKRAIAAAEEAPPEDRVRAGLEALIELAETDPAAARSALRELRSGSPSAWAGSRPGWAETPTGRHSASAPRSSWPMPSWPPPPRTWSGSAPELLRWLEGDW